MCIYELADKGLLFSLENNILKFHYFYFINTLEKRRKEKRGEKQFCYIREIDNHSSA